MGESTVEMVIRELKELKGELKTVKVSSPKELFSSIVLVVRFLERLSKDERVQKNDKKALAVDVINQLVDVPYIPEFVEGKLISFLIDMSVETLNQSLGKDWLLKLN